MPRVMTIIFRCCIRQTFGRLCFRVAFDDRLVAHNYIIFDSGSLGYGWRVFVLLV